LSYVIGFAEEDAIRQDLVGATGARLGRRAAAGSQVPAGFAVTGYAYDRFMLESGLSKRWPTTVEGRGGTGHGDAVRAALQTLRGEILSAPLPASVEAQVGEAWKRFIVHDAADDRVAVRSSAISDDPPPDLYDSFSDVRGIDATLAAVRRCWASLWTVRATRFRLRSGFEQPDVRLAVVVQTAGSEATTGIAGNAVADPLGA
jgi:phosphoenolpyruvate synthase/pyruvate phosphate dikinase